MATIIAIHTADQPEKSSLKPGLPGEIPSLDQAELGERILDLMVSEFRAPLPNAAGIVIAMDALRAVAASHGLDATSLWIGSDPLS
jgi:hypothetical protein